MRIGKAAFCAQKGCVDPEDAPSSPPWVRALFLALAAIFFGLAVLGAFLPVLPTTPFLLLTSACLLRSSRRWHARLRSSRVFGALIRDWEEHRAISRPVRWTALTVLAAVAGYGLLVAALALWLRILLGLLVAAGLLVILRLPVRRGED